MVKILPKIKIFWLIFRLFPHTFFRRIFFVLYSAQLHLPPLRFHCADGCWDRTQDRCNWCIFPHLGLMLFCAGAWCRRWASCSTAPPPSSSTRSSPSPWPWTSAPSSPSSTSARRCPTWRYTESCRALPRDGSHICHLFSLAVTIVLIFFLM